MSITFIKTFKRTTVETPWFDTYSTEYRTLHGTLKASGKILHSTWTKPNPLTRTYTRTFVNQAAFDEWFANPIVAESQTQQRSYEITNNQTWTRVITNNETGATTTDSSADYSLSLVRG